MIIMIRFLVVILLIGFVLTYLLGFSIFRSFKSFFLPDDRNGAKQRPSSRDNRQQKNHNNTRQKKHTKVIREDEGEYVDYEEIK
ncbi:MAG: DUF4834 family protein [Tannerella sp.]|jgi:hypothetical protein|nr:DUF4834 family protein [Tannerella sp.]